MNEEKWYKKELYEMKKLSNRMPDYRGFRGSNELFWDEDVKSLGVITRNRKGISGFFYISPEDVNLLSGVHYHLLKGAGTRKEYAMGVISKKKVWFHHLIVPRAKGLVVDHINRNTLDNRRQNLRLATVSENAKNKEHINKYGQKGVSKQGNNFVVFLTVEGKQNYFGSFKHVEQAKSMAKQMIKELNL